MQASGNVYNRMQFLMADCLLSLRKERYTVSDEMLANSHQALADSLVCGTLKNRIECQFELGFLHLWRRELDEAEDNLQATLNLSLKIGPAADAHPYFDVFGHPTSLSRSGEEVSAYTLRAHQAAAAAGMPDYEAAAKGNQAWLAWRKGDVEGVEQSGGEALQLWRQSPLVYPFKWLAIWPLIGVMLTQGRINKCMGVYPTAARTNPTNPDPAASFSPGKGSSSKRGGPERRGSFLPGSSPGIGRGDGLPVNKSQVQVFLQQPPKKYASAKVFLRPTP